MPKLGGRLRKSSAEGFIVAGASVKSFENDHIYTEHSFLIRGQSVPLDAFSNPLISNSRTGLVAFLLELTSGIRNERK